MPAIASPAERPSAADSVEAVKDYIAANWAAVTRGPDENVLPVGTRALPSEGKIALPEAYIVPTAAYQPFQMFFYWDTYFACEGLLRSGQIALAKANADNFLYLIDLLGFVPNYNLWQDLDRSQPPVASLLVRAVYERTRNKEWLARAAATLEKEHAFWMASRCGPDGLNHYGSHSTPAQLQRFMQLVNEHDRIKHVPSGPFERTVFLRHLVAEAESGWDFTPRFGHRCSDHYATDLNGLLHRHELNQAWFCEELGDGRAALWHERARVRRERFNRLCWDNEIGLYFDYDFVLGRRSPLATAAAYWALWGGLASPAQAQCMADALPLLERGHGLLTCQPHIVPRAQVYQWDAPNAWPPLQFGAIAGLNNAGQIAAAQRLASKYVATVTRNFVASGNLWEKYNAVTGGVDVAEEYESPPLMDWTAGTFLYACAVLEEGELARGVPRALGKLHHVETSCSLATRERD